MDFIFWTYPLIIRENVNRGLDKPYLIIDNQELQKLVLKSRRETNIKNKLLE